jgi:hypothetical protein
MVRRRQTGPPCVGAALATLSGARYLGRMDQDGFVASTWRAAKVFTGRIAQPVDVEAGLAVFALTDTHNGQAFEDPLPQPAIWYDEDDQHAVLIVQAEVHDAEDAAGEVERLEVLGLLLPDGQTRIGFTEDVEEVAADDPAWLALIELARGPTEEAADQDALDGEDD